MLNVEECPGKPQYGMAQGNIRLHGSTVAKQCGLESLSHLPLFQCQLSLWFCTTVSLRMWTGK